jgi:protocatechuate 3,4-dioxygenase beta subunit
MSLPHVVAEGLAGLVAREATAEDVEGPFYRPDAPFRNVLAEEGEGERLIIGGSVHDTSGVPVPGALIDVWQASSGPDARVDYDRLSDQYRLRGRLFSDQHGGFVVVTVLPGRYFDVDRLRPRHVHFKVSHAAHCPLTTQLYFQGDHAAPYDLYYQEELAVPLFLLDGVWRATFDIVLRPR